MRGGYVSNLELMWPDNDWVNYNDEDWDEYDPCNLNKGSDNFWEDVEKFKDAYDGTFLVQVILTDDQLENSEYVEALKNRGFMFVTSWVNVNTGNRCNLFVLHDQLDDDKSRKCQAVDSFPVINKP
jgi:hypothetical protein